MLKFSIIIPTHKNPRGLFRLLRSLQDIDGTSESEILVISNPPGDRALAKALSNFDLNIRFLDCAKGVNRARNLGLREGLGEILFFLDDDCWISQRDFLSRHQSEHELNPEVYAVGGFYQVLSQRSCDRAYGRIQNEWLKQCQLNGSGEARSLIGGHFSIKKAMSTHFFDESILYGGAETEFFVRLFNLGFRFKLIDFAIIHEPRVGYLSLIKKAYLQGKTRRRFKHLANIENAFLMDKRANNFATYLYQIAFHMALPPREISYKKVSLLKKLRRQLISLHQTICFYIDHRSSF